MSFENFALDSAIMDGLREMGYEKPTEIQEKAIPIILTGHDLIALSETGSGKTACSAIPICQKINPLHPQIQSLIIVPTRELALQYATETQKIGRFKKIKTFALYGGEDNLALQQAKLKAGVHVLIATPGRLIDFIYSRFIHLADVQILVLDEADQMLSMGFYEDLEFIMNCLIQEHQTLLFSATMPKEIKKIARSHMKDAHELTLIQKQVSPEQLIHHFYFCESFSKRRSECVKVLQASDVKQCLIFVNSRREVEELFSLLKSILSGVDFLHGGMVQAARNSVIGKFAKGKIRFLIATDVAARGLDFSAVSHVINYHFPLDMETYLHRAGRTARLGRKGTCITFVLRKEMQKAKKLMQVLKGGEWINHSPYAKNHS